MYNNNIPISIPSHSYVLMNRSILCNCDLETENNFLLESLAVCEKTEMKSDSEMYFTANLAFIDHFKDVVETFEIPVNRNWTMQEQILPISIESDEFNDNLLNVPKTLKEFIYYYKNKRERSNNEKIEENFKFNSFLNSYTADVLIFTATLVTMVLTIVVIHVIFKQTR